ncbi:AAA family ATPase [Seminavis robusta]|uniref:AAA family ATPase n=1 Tax=Seminavis robusta TaxID=568900 RepID=A0A9N8HLR0_9STRA|nr:AAA family ATPase [Seminavis robusta]|eukprot:Sro698_g189170.1 AAA family ATPase (841) ;mRNA; r:10928-13450
MTKVAPSEEGKPEYDADALMKKIQDMYDTLPDGWSKNPNPGKNGSAPFVHVDGRVSWKHPSREQMNKVISDMTGSKDGLKIPDDKKVLIKRYRSMLQSGVPKPAVEQRARLEGVDPAMIYAAEEEQPSADKPRKKYGAAAKKAGCVTAYQNGALKRFRQMIKAGLPMAAVKQAADLQGVDISELINANNADCKELSKPFEGPNNNQVVFQKGADLTRLVTKLVQTISKRATASTDLTVELRVLYHALGSLRGVQHSRDVYNGTTSKKMPIMEMRSKRKPWLELAGSLAIPTPADWKDAVDIEGLDDLVKCIEQAYKDDLQAISSQVGVGVYDFGSLAQIYAPGTRVVATNAFVGGVGMICEVAWNRFEEGKTLFGISRTFKVCFNFVVAVGKHFTIAECVETMEDFDGKRQISLLNFFPLAGYSTEEAEQKVAQFEARGRLYNEVATKQAYMEYEKGSFYGKRTGNVDPGANALHMGGRVMVDTQGSYENGFSIGTGYDPMVMGIKYKYKEYMLQMRAQKEDAGSSAKSGGADGKMILFETVPEDYLAMTWPAVVGFSFHSKVWGDVLVDGLKHIEYQEDIFDKIVLPPARKRMVKALVKHSCDAFNDVVRGKGEGSVFLLYGEPGVGKTLTAEAVCEMLHKPLYTVSLGQLGSTAATLEKNLNDILTLCARWDALILLDECDLYVEKRSSGGSLERNAMVSVMLRLVEYFKGVLFLTSNRIDSLDPAFKTRITLALRYDALDFAGRNQIWINLLETSGFGAAVKNGDINTEELANSVMNGREIKNSIRLAMALAAEDGEPLSQKFLLETVAILDEYNQQAASPEVSYDNLTSSPRSVEV